MLILRQNIGFDETGRPEEKSNFRGEETITRRRVNVTAFDKLIFYVAAVVIPWSLIIQALVLATHA